MNTVLRLADNIYLKAMILPDWSRPVIMLMDNEKSYVLGHLKNDEALDVWEEMIQAIDSGNPEDFELTKGVVMKNVRRTYKKTRKTTET